MVPFSQSTRQVVLDGVQTPLWDLIIVGGGITGAGVLRDAATRGMRVLLLEKNDFSSGTSSKSSKLIHGGLRYLKQFHFGLTREACLERNLLARNNPHLVEPLPFLLPIYRGDKDGAMVVNLAMWTYEILSGFRNHKRFKMLTAQQCLEMAPDLKQEGLRSGAFYYDAWVDDSRLVLESIKAGVREGGQALSQVEVTGLRKNAEGQVTGVFARDILADKNYEISAHVVLNATGTWVDSLRNMDRTGSSQVVRPTKGVHIIVSHSRIRQNPTLAFPAVQDHRLLFSIPQDDVIILGTTDTDFDGNKDEVTATAEDVKYLLDATNHIFPGANLTEADIISSYAGLRPLIAGPADADPSSVSREHEIFQDPSGLISVAGGKLTTYRLMAKELTNLVKKRLPRGERKRLRKASTAGPITGTIVDVAGEHKRLANDGLAKVVATHLIKTYGPDVAQVLELAEGMVDGRAPLVQGQGYIRAEVTYAVRFESALHLSDVLTRRLRMALWSPGQGLAAAETVSHIMAAELGWSDERRRAELSDYQQTVYTHHRPITNPL